MSDKVKPHELVPQLRQTFMGALREVLIGLPPAQALQAADHLCEVLAESLRGLIVDGGPAVPRRDPAAITRDWQDGLGVDEIMRRHSCSRATAYNHHPSKARRRRRAEPAEAVAKKV